MRLAFKSITSLEAGIILAFQDGGSRPGWNGFLDHLSPLGEYWDLVVLGLAPPLAVLALWLFLRRTPSGPDWRAERQWPGHGIDTRSVFRRVEHVRQHYVSELRLPLNASHKRLGLVACARRRVGGLRYFRSRKRNPAAPAREDIHGA
jgi:hypothetical protein